MVAHRFDPRGVLGEDLERGAFALVGDAAIEVDDPGCDPDIDARARPPGLLLDLGEDVVADLAIGQRGLPGWLWQVLQQRLQQIGAADDADEPPLRDHRQALDMVTLHQPDHFGERVLRRHRNDIRAHHHADFLRVGLGVFLGEAARRDQDFEPSRMAALGPGLGPTQDVAFGNDAHHPPGFIDHGQPADPVPQHPPRRVGDRGFRLYGDHPPGHDIGHIHRQSPIVPGWVSPVLTP